MPNDGTGQPGGGGHRSEEPFLGPGKDMRAKTNAAAVMHGVDGQSGSEFGGSNAS
ncbi:hypothetical protein [Nocardia wallacei]|uniref:hypothetical protein n=1 Tax=Nocardia wallacei TaxID=480035 RepID=UPI0024544AEE|nr:hypothetical protein [Nocardia wallacei]